MPVSITWILEVGIPLFFSALIIAWFGTILYYIPFQLYLDKRAANTRGHSVRCMARCRRARAAAC